MIEEIKDYNGYYGRLGTHKLDNLDWMGKFLDTELLKLTQERENLIRPVTSKEIEAQKTRKKKKPRWFECWFYQKFKIIPILHKLFQ